MSDSIHIHTFGQICTISLNRPDKRNAFDDGMIKELQLALSDINADQSIRLVVLTGEGSVFSSGADLNWMRSMIEYDHEANCVDAMQLATMLHTLYSLNKPTIARINGPAFGGAIGLIACCDIAVSVNDAKFGFTEVKLGIIPAVISPYIVSAIGHRTAKRLFLSGEIFSSSDALKYGLIHYSVTGNQLDETVNKQAAQLLQAGPLAQAECKRLIQKLASVSDDLGQYTAELIAQIRTSDEGQEGLTAFLEKRKPRWQTIK